MFTATICDEQVAVKVMRNAEALGETAYNKAFANGDPIVVANAARIAATSHEHEQTVLSAIAKVLPDDPGHAHLPLVHAQSNPRMALITTPAGTPLCAFVQANKSPTGGLSTMLARKIVSDILMGLRVAHFATWVHLDLRMDNIILKEVSRDNVPHAVLVDWGVASTDGSSGKGMSGTYHAAATEICMAATSGSEWKSNRKHDLEGILYLYETLLQGSPTWCNADLTRMLADRDKLVAQRKDSDDKLSAFCEQLRGDGAIDGSMYDSWL